MSVTLMAKVFACKMPELKTENNKTVPDTTAKFVLLALADNANEEGEGAYPGVKSLCKKTNFSTSTVVNALSALRNNGFTTLEGKSKYDTNSYTINVQKLDENKWPEEARFQPPKSRDSSHRNRTILATETNPSVKPIKYTCPIIESLTANRVRFNVMTAGQLIDEWKTVHSDEWILKAIAKSQGKHSNYVDAILAGWERDGYPSPRQKPPSAPAEYTTPANVVW